jgi:hypothetical protein
MYRVAAIEWEAGIHLGYSFESGVRGDDPNDLVPHENRRTVRALRVFASWLALDGLGPSKTVDRYVGPPREGHVVHYVAGLDDALGANDIVRTTDPPPAEGAGPPFTRFITLGLAKNRPRVPTQTEMPALGELSGEVDPAGYEPPVPYEPADRLSPSDGYWAAKRIAALSRVLIALAIEAGRVDDLETQRRMQAALEARRLAIMGYWFGRVTPLELVSVAGDNIVVRDEAVAHDLVPLDSTDYRIDFLTSAATEAAPAMLLHPADGLLDFVLPTEALTVARDYLVLEITARRGKHVLPRSFQLHLSFVGNVLKVLGIRH